MTNKRKKVSLPRSVALDLLNLIFIKKQTLDQAIFTCRNFDSLTASDKGFSRLLTVTVIRRVGQLDNVIQYFFKTGMPKNARDFKNILRLASAEILFLDGKPHAAVDSAVTLVEVKKLPHLKGLTNAILRRLVDEGGKILKSAPGRLNYPKWLIDSWSTSYGTEIAEKIFLMCVQEPKLDISVKSKHNSWAEKLGGKVLRTGSIRRKFSGRIENLPGYDEGAWWVQDAGATLPVQLFGDLKGADVLDVCAAPGGKTAQLLSAGANATAIDISAKRLGLLRQNLDRLELRAELIQADIKKWSTSKLFDFILVDAPCSATGTIRRNPDILILKTDADVQKLRLLQTEILKSVSRLVKPGGKLVYCTCSLQYEEGEAQIDHFLSENKEFTRSPIDAHEIGDLPDAINKNGDLRLLPFHLDRTEGSDSFFAARLFRK